MKMQVHIYLSGDNKIQVLLQGQAQGAATFGDLDTFVRFIEGCQDFINKYAQENGGVVEIPQPFLDAFEDKDNS